MELGKLRVLPYALYKTWPETIIKSEQAFESAMSVAWWLVSIRFIVAEAAV